MACSCSGPFSPLKPLDVPSKHAGVQWSSGKLRRFSSCSSPAVSAAKGGPASRSRQSSSSSSGRHQDNIALVAQTIKDRGSSSAKDRSFHLSFLEIQDERQLPLPSPPTGFVLNEDGGVALMSPPNKRVTTIVDSATGQPLDCLIRRDFTSLDGRQCFLLCPLDTPVQIMRIRGDEVLVEVSDNELEDILPTASYELAKRRLHLVFSGFCLTVRGGFCYTEDHVMDFNAVYDGDALGESLNEGLELASFKVGGSEYLVYTPFDPLMFVAYKDNDTGELTVADDDLLDDEAVLDAIDEEKEFQAHMDEEIARLIEAEESDSD